MSRRAAGAGPWQRRSLGVLLFVWLTAALQPCVMAMPSMAGSPAEDVPHRCPHCPPQERDAHAGHRQHDHSDPAGAASASCLAAEDNCAPFDEPFLDTRENGLRVPDAPDSDGPAALPVGELAFERSAAWCLLPPAQAPPRAPAVRTHLLNCVFLQ